MSNWRALTLKQPWAWAISHAGKDVENRTWPVPPKLLNQVCTNCDGTMGEDPSLGWSYNGIVEPGSIPPCHRCSSPIDGLPTGFEPLRVLIHAGAAWDKTATHKHRFGFSASEHDCLPDKSSVWYNYKSKDWGKVAPAMGGFIRGAGSNLRQPFSAVVAVATITGSHEDCRDDHPELWCSPDWAMPSTDDKPMHHWQLADVQTLAEPVLDVKGKLGLWKPDAALIEAVEAQL